MVEHLVCNQAVVGSNPVASTTLPRCSACPGQGPSRETLSAWRLARVAGRQVIFENEVNRERW